MFKKWELHEFHAYVTNIINPYTWLMAWQWYHFVLASNTKEEWPRITYATSRQTKNYRVSSMQNCVKLYIIALNQKVV